MDQGHQWLRLLALFDGVMMGNDLDNVLAQTPLFGQGASSFAVREAHRRTLRFYKRDLLLDGVLDRPCKRLVESQTVDQEPNVMHQAGHVRLLAIGPRQLLTEFSAHHRATEGMPPEDGRIKRQALRG